MALSPLRVLSDLVPGFHHSGPALSLKNHKNLSLSPWPYLDEASICFAENSFRKLVKEQTPAYKAELSYIFRERFARRQCIR